MSYQIHDALTRGVPLARAIETVTQSHNESWRAVGAAWAIARASGAPLAPALIALSNALGDIDTTRREMQATLAGPKATLRLVFALPVLALVGGALSGVNAWSAVMSHPLGLLALGVGVSCFLGAWWWIRLLTHRAMPTATPGFPAPGSLCCECLRVDDAGACPGARGRDPGGLWIRAPCRR